LCSSKTAFRFGCTATEKTFFSKEGANLSMENLQEAEIIENEKVLSMEGVELEPEDFSQLK
jgi:hypothetical protein